MAVIESWATAKIFLLLPLSTPLAILNQINMKHTSKILAILTFIFLKSTIGCSQIIKVCYGLAYTETKQIIPLKNGSKGDIADANTTNVFILSYEHFLPNSQITLFGSFSKFNGYTFMFFENGGVIEYENELHGVGFNGVNVMRFDVGASYRLTDNKKRFYFKPFLACGIQMSKKNGEEIYSELLNANGPSYFQLEPIRADPRNTTQFTPSIGFNTGFVFWRRLDIGISFQGVFGHKPYQKMYFKYEYKGTPQPTAEFEANGTGLFVSLGMGYRFAKLIK